MKGKLLAKTKHASLSGVLEYRPFVLVAHRCRFANN